MEDGGHINAIYFKVPNSRGVIYYLKGNSRSIKGWGKFAKDFLSNGYDFFMMDYRGSGNLLYLPLEKVMQAAGAPEGAAPSAAPAAPPAEAGPRSRETLRNRERGDR
jgi:alpha-beta hydrolase superfamily lysophospholipase